MSIYNISRSQLAVVPHNKNGVVEPADAHHRIIEEGPNALRSYHVSLTV